MTLTAADLTDVPAEPGTPPGEKEGQTSFSHGHSHHVTLDANGNGVTDVVQGHYHRVHAEKINGRIHYIVGPPEDELTARVPIYGKLRMLDRSGKPTAVGINIGKEWTYRSFLDGGTPMAAIWTFSGITKDKFPDGRLPLEMFLRVFRTYKGKIADEKRNNRPLGILAAFRSAIRSNRA